MNSLKLFTVLLAATMLATPLLAQGRPEPATVCVKDGNIIYSPIWNQRTQLTFSGKDSDPVVSPDGEWVVFTREGDHSTYGEDASPECVSGDKADELRRISVDGTREELLYRGGNYIEQGTPGNVCSFDTKHFTSDGRFLYFLAPGWATSAALFRFDYYNKSVVFVTDANNVVVLSNCKHAEYKDHLLVLQHRYFVGGGSFDWYWLYKPGQFDRSSDPEYPYVFTNGSVDPVGPFERGADAAAHVCGGQ